MLLIAVVTARVAVVTWSAIGRVRGDFYASMPGAYVETLNPELWNSPDMTGAWGYHRDTYFHGPAQYLTLYPLALLDSFGSIAAVLLPVYAVLLAAAFWWMWKVAKRLGASHDLLVPLLASTFLFLAAATGVPTARIRGRRDSLALSGALLLLLNDRRGPAAALLAYVAWFKYIPLLYAGYLLLRRWWRELAVFAAVSVAVLIAVRSALRIVEVLQQQRAGPCGPGVHRLGL